MRASRMAVLLGLVAQAATAAVSRHAVPLDTMAEGNQAVVLDRLEVTQGAVQPRRGGRLSIEVPRFRAVVAEVLRPPVELLFTWKGPTHEQIPLRSGELRQQIGLKLRAKDGCNVVYAMWRLAPEPGVVVQVKHNPGLSASAECGNQGYQTVWPRSSRPPPDVVPGKAHVMRVEQHGARLQVLVDGAPVWLGVLPPEALTFDGPVGLRTDNGRFDVELRTEP